jgi:SAM-dependent methyltransferase
LDSHGDEVSQLDRPLVVPERALPYLQVQRGAISDMAASRWPSAYAEMLYSEFDCLEPYLPANCEAVLDVGSGLGGIDILLARHYGDGLSITLLDGHDDRAQVRTHAETFNSMEVAREFLAANGVGNVHCLDANSHPLPPAPSFFDLVISLKAWCFHIEPDRYIDWVLRHSIAGETRIIIDVRRPARPDSPHWEWFSQLARAFGNPVREIYVGAKFSTVLYQV